MSSSSASSASICGSFVVSTGAPSGPLLCEDSWAACAVGAGGDVGRGFGSFCLPFLAWVSVGAAFAVLGIAGLLDMLIDDDDRDAFHAPLAD